MSQTEQAREIVYSELQAQIMRLEREAMLDPQALCEAAGGDWCMEHFDESTPTRDVLLAVLRERTKDVRTLRDEAQISRDSRRIAEEVLFAVQRERDELRDAVVELFTVAQLRGDNVLPSPTEDFKVWTARMQTAWDRIEALIANGEKKGE